MKLGIPTLILAVIAVGALVFLAEKYVVPEGANTHPSTNTDNTVCAQVITSARDPKTGYIKQYPTPCDVPEGWEVIINDVPGLY